MYIFLEETCITLQTNKQIHLACEFFQNNIEKFDKKKDADMAALEYIGEDITNKNMMAISRIRRKETHTDISNYYNF